MNGHRGYYEDGWEIVTLHQPLTPFDDAEWELYDLTTDPIELDDRSASEPERRRQLIDAWEREAWANQIYPLDEGSSIKYLIRPERSEIYREPVTIVAGTPTLERWRSVQLIWFRSVTITASIDFRPGDQGMLVAHGDQGGGYALYVLDDELWFVHNDGRGVLRKASGGRLAEGVSEVTASLDAIGGGTWTLRVSVDGEPRAEAARPAAALRHGAVRGHRRGHRPALAGELGDLRAVRPVRLHRHAPLGGLRAGRGRARLAGQPDGHHPPDGRGLRVRGASE